MIDKERFHELMELICDNCLALHLNEESADDDPADWHDFCSDCFIEEAVHDALDAAERERLRNQLSDVTASLAELGQQ